MNTYPTLVSGLGEEVLYWLEQIGYHQALHVLDCLAKIFNFAQRKANFFQGCGLYVVGSSLAGGKFNDIDIVLVGLDFRAVVEYDKIFLMDPETLIEKGVLVEPRLFVIVEGNEDSESMVIVPATDIDNPHVPSSIEQYSRMGLVHEGVRYDYNIERHMGDSLSLEGYCLSHAWPSVLTKQINELFCPPSIFSSLSNPFDNYGFGGQQPFLVYRFPIEVAGDLPGIKKSALNRVRLIDFCIHAENLQKVEWKNHQRSLGLPFLTLKEWPAKRNPTRKIITDLPYPRFIDPEGQRRAKWDVMLCESYQPEETPDIIDV